MVRDDFEDDMDLDDLSDVSTSSQGEHESDDVAIVSAHQTARIVHVNVNRIIWCWKAASRVTSALWNYKNNQPLNTKDLKMCLTKACDLTVYTE